MSVGIVTPRCQACVPVFCPALDKEPGDKADDGDARDASDNSSDDCANGGGLGFGVAGGATSG
jgi:hypothetical protein